MALAAELDLEHRSGGVSFKGIATSTDNLGIHILRVNILPHQAFFPSRVYTLTFLLCFEAGSYLTMPSIRANSV
jgi:hypothetical protein